MDGRAKRVEEDLFPREKSIGRNRCLSFLSRILGTNLECSHCRQHFFIVALETNDGTEGRRRRKKLERNTVADSPIFTDKDVWLVKKCEEKKSLRH